MVIVVVLPLPEFLIEEVNVVADAVLVEELVKLLVIDAVGSFDLAIQVRCSRSDVDVADIERLQVPVKLGLEFGAIVGLHDLNAEGQASADFLNEANRRALMARVIDL
jgi:hypothetical protein